MKSLHTVFKSHTEEILRFQDDKVFWRGREITKDAELVAGMRDVLAYAPRASAMADVLETVRNPGTRPIGAPGSVMREAWELGTELTQARCFSAHLRERDLEITNLKNSLANQDEKMRAALGLLREIEKLNIPATLLELEPK